jgi:hypothetical protein
MAEQYEKTIQIGKETTHGTHVPATFVLPADAPIPADISPHRPKYNLGVRVQSAESAVLYKAVDSLPITMDDSYFQMLHFFLATCLKGGVTGAEQKTGQHDYLADYTPGLTQATASNQNSCTIEIFDSQHVVEIGYVMTKSIHHTWTFGKDGKLTTAADCFGDFVDPTITKTPGLSLGSNTLINPNLLKFYADTTWAGAGGTQLLGILRQVDLEIIGGVHQKPPHGNGIIPDSHGVTWLSWKLGLTLEDNSDALEFYNWYRAQTAVCIRLDQEGPAIGTGANHSLIYDLWGTPDKADAMGQQDQGDQLMPVSMSELYNSVSAKTLSCKLCTTLQALQ